MSCLSEAQAGALRQLLLVWPADKLVLIGAMALECRTGLGGRATQDIDLSVGTDVAKATNQLRQLGWRQDSAAPQRWFTPEGVKIDVIPCSPTTLEEGGFNWPDGGARMSLIGFRLMQAEAQPVEIVPGLTFRIASLRSIVLLKMVAFLDRPFERDNDLADIVHVLARSEPSLEEHFTEDVLDLRLDYEDVGLYRFGQELRSVVDRKEADAVARFLDLILDENRPGHLYKMARAAPPGWRDPDALRQRWTSFRRGFESAT